MAGRSDKADSLKQLQAELDHRTEVENQAILLISECKFKEATELLNTLDDSVVQDEWQVLTQQVKEVGEESMMTLEKILEMGLIKNSTEIIVRQSGGFHVLAHGDQFEADILEYMYHGIESFIWQDDNKIYIDVK